MSEPMSEPMRDDAGDATRWARAEAVFGDVADLPRAEQRAAVDRLCAGNALLAADVVALLDGDAQGLRLLDGGVAAAARALLDAADGADRPVPDVPFGPYRAVRYLNAGGMGVVYLADRGDGAFVALKVLRHAALSPAWRERFAAEQRTLARLHHPNIARLHDAGTLADGTPWIAMEYVDGDDLIAYCRRRDCPLAERLRVFRVVCEAVQYAHEQMIVHRDLKPSNILVASGGAAKLLDFGIAKSLDPDDARDPTRTGFRLLTPAYAAPEQFRGDDTGAAIDVYALGVVLYELITGRLPFDVAARSPGEAEAMILTREPERPSVVARRTTPGSPAGRLAPVAGVSRPEWDDLDVLCLTAMRKEPARRYRTVVAFMQDVDRYLRHEPLAAQPDALGYRAGKFVRRNRRPLSAVAAVFLLVAGLVSFYTVRLASARDAALAQAARTARVQSYTASLFNGGDEDQGPADTVHVATLLDRGLQEARALDGDPAVQADLLFTLGNIYQRLGRFDRADSVLHVVLDRRHALVGPEHPDVAAVLVALGEVREEQGRLDEAERFARAGLAMARRTGPATDPRVAHDMTALARVLVQARRGLPEAVTLTREAARLQSASGTPTRELGITLQVLGIADTYAGDFAAADSAQRAGLAIDRRLYPAGHPQIASDLSNIGAVAFQRGDYVEAERAYREGLRMIEAWYGRDHMQTGTEDMLLAQALMKLKRLDEAASLLERALAIEERVRDPAHPSVVNTLNTLGVVAMQRGRLDDAEQYFDRVIATMRAAGDSNSLFVGGALSNEGSVWLRRGDPARAERLERDALAVLVRNQAGDPLSAGIARVRLGRALTREARWADAERELLAGYAVVDPRAPASDWATEAREDLAAVYDATGRHEEARKYRAAVLSRADPATQSAPAGRR